MSDDAPPWFEGGLCFACTHCGHCCQGAGNAWIREDEIAVLADALDVREAEFRKVYVRRLGGAGPILRQKRNQDCIFWAGEGGCDVYAHRTRLRLEAKAKG